MKKTILTLASVLVLLTSCTKEDELQPVSCDQECGFIRVTAIYDRSLLYSGSDDKNVVFRVAIKNNCYEEIFTQDLSHELSLNEEVSIKLAGATEIERIVALKELFSTMTGLETRGDACIDEVRLKLNQ